jgi:hypothetical protein
MPGEQRLAKWASELTEFRKFAYWADRVDDSLAMAPSALKRATEEFKIKWARERLQQKRHESLRLKRACGGRDLI